ncbi:hypothetical protein AB0J83_23145 [Actinoplanes sp. NPDC049596]|uniref:hypothetical protein n=1 Tax=unclassified Actinoplanes TaxID=2626549 RepID=UPI00341CC438
MDDDLRRSFDQCGETFTFEEIDLRNVRRLMSAAGAAVLVALSLTVAASPAQAAQPANGWYMLVNDYYDGGSGHDNGDMWCLSANNQTSPSGSGTNQVYLAPCNPATAGQWWYKGSADGYEHRTFVNYQNFDNAVWELSSNASTPSGFAAGTHGVYTAQKAARTSIPDGHNWNVIEYTDPYKFRFQSLVLGENISASHNNTYPAGTFKVYNTPVTNPPAAAHLWRFWQPAGRPTNCTCGDTTP